MDSPAIQDLLSPTILLTPTLLSWAMVNTILAPLPLLLLARCLLSQVQGAMVTPVLTRQLPPSAPLPCQHMAMTRAV